MDNTIRIAQIISFLSATHSAQKDDRHCITAKQTANINELKTQIGIILKKKLQ
jgi:hypothetical protein